MDFNAIKACAAMVFYIFLHHLTKQQALKQTVAFREDRQRRIPARDSRDVMCLSCAPALMAFSAASANAWTSC